MVRTQYEFHAKGHIGKGGTLFEIDRYILASSEKECESILANLYRDKPRARVDVYCEYTKTAEVTGRMNDDFYWANAEVTRKEL